MLRCKVVDPLRISVSYFVGVFLLLGCSPPPSFTFTSNPVRTEKYSSNIISLKLNDVLSQYKIEWLCADKEWYCRIVTSNLFKPSSKLSLRVRTPDSDRKFIFHARRGGDVYRLREEDTSALISLLTNASTAEFFIGSSCKKVECEEFKTLLKKAKKNQSPLIEL